MPARTRTRFSLPGETGRRPAPSPGRWLLLLAALALGSVAWRQGWLPGGTVDPLPTPGGIAIPDPRPSLLPDTARTPIAREPVTNGTSAAIDLPPVVGATRGPLSPATPATATVPGSRPVADVLEAQVQLASHGINGGAIDGVLGAQTAAAIRSFQLQQALEQTGRLDATTRAVLRIDRPAIGPYTVGEADLAGLAPTPATWCGKSQVSGLPHENLLERVAERTHAHPRLLRQLNPTIDWSRLTAGTVLAVPAARFPTPRRAARVRISLSHRHLRAFDESGILIAHFPCSIGRIADRRPVGDLHVVTLVAEPNYTFDPRVFPESEEGRRIGRRLIIPPGPNNPVGVAWIGLDRPGYGIHGTPSP